MKLNYSGIFYLNAFMLCINYFAISQPYREVKIGTQVWMADNLRVEYFRNGDPIPYARTAEEWIQAGKNKKPAWRNVGDWSSRHVSSQYGRLYNWYAVNDPRGLAPAGWYIPKDDEFTKLIDFLGGELVAGASLKSNNAWFENGNGTNSSGFNAMAAGYTDYLGTENGFERFGYWWSSSESIGEYAWGVYLFYAGSHVGRYTYGKDEGLAIRCIKSEPDPVMKDISIGSQIWSAENLAVSHFQNGDPIQFARTMAEWQQANDANAPVWCYYNFDANYAKFGKLYNWFAVNDKRGLAPLGWHIPSDEEWTLLTKEIGYKVGREYNKAEKKLKSTSGWEEGLNGNNKSGFNALPAGHIVDDEFYGYGWYAGWWSSTRNNSNSAFGRQFIRADGFWREPFSTYTGLSIRCVKN